MGTSTIESTSRTTDLPGFKPIGAGPEFQDQWPGITTKVENASLDPGPERSAYANLKQFSPQYDSMGKPAKNGPKQKGELTQDQQREVEKLKARDQEVKAHEMAHMAAGGQYAGSATYSYQTGPDGKRYAIGGEVSIDASPVKDDPSATVRKMEVVQRAALAPAEPSGQDLAVAAAAAQEEAKAASEARQTSSGGSAGKSNDANGASQQPDKTQKQGTPDNQITAKKDKNLRYTINSKNQAPVMVSAQKQSQHINMMA
jgi:hypothetical protein